MRGTATLLGMFTAAAGVWLAVMESVLRHPGFTGRMAIAVLITAVSACSAAALRDGTRRPAVRDAVGAGGVAVLAFGAAALVRTLSSPHFEGFALVIAAALVVQGILTLATLRRERPSPARG